MIGRTRQSIERALTRRTGMQPAPAAELLDQVNRFENWRVYCYSCHKTIVGTQQQVIEHGETCRAS